MFRLAYSSLFYALFAKVETGSVTTVILNGRYDTVLLSVFQDTLSMAVLITCSLKLSINVLCISLGSVIQVSLVQAKSLHGNWSRLIPVFYPVAQFQLIFLVLKVQKIVICLCTRQEERL